MDRTESTPLPPIEEMESSTAVAERAAGGELNLEAFNLKKLALAYFGPWRANVTETKQKLTGVVHDLSTPTKIADAKSLRHRLIGQPLAAARATSEALKKKLNGAKTDVVSELAAIEAGYEEAAKLITPQIEAAEARIAEEKRIAAEKEAARVQAHRDNLATLARYAEKARAPDMTAERIATGIRQVQQIQVDVTAWEEFADQAKEQLAVTLEQMQALHAKALAAEAEAARLEADRIENERRAAELKAEADRLAAERAELDRARAEIEAARAAAAAEAQARAEEAARLERQQQAQAEAAARELAEAQARAAEGEARAAAQREAQERSNREAAEAHARNQAAAEAAQAEYAARTAKEPLPAPAPEVRAFPAPAAEAPTLLLGELWKMLGFDDREAFLESLGFPATPAPKGTGKLYRRSDLQAIRRAIAKRMTEAANFLEAA
jgi:hypothetical protein